MTLSTSQVASGSGGGTATRFTYTDASGLVSPSIAAELGGSPTSDAAAARADVVAGRADLHIDYPRDPASEPVRLTCDAPVHDVGRSARLACVVGGGCRGLPGARSSASASAAVAHRGRVVAAASAAERRSLRVVAAAAAAGRRVTHRR